MTVLDFLKGFRKSSSLPLVSKTSSDILIDGCAPWIGSEIAKETERAA
jgi:hypothetical protein